MALPTFSASSQFMQSSSVTVKPDPKHLIDDCEVSSGSCNLNQSKISRKSSLSRFILPCFYLFNIITLFKVGVQTQIFANKK